MCWITKSSGIEDKHIRGIEACVRGGGYRRELRACNEEEEQSACKEGGRRHWK